MSMNINNFGLPRQFASSGVSAPPSPTAEGETPRSAGINASPSLKVVSSVNGAEEVTVPEEALRRDDALGRLVNAGFSPSSIVLPAWQEPA